MVQRMHTVEHDHMIRVQQAFCLEALPIYTAFQEMDERWGFPSSFARFAHSRGHKLVQKIESALRTLSGDHEANVAILQNITDLHNIMIELGEKTELDIDHERYPNDRDYARRQFPHLAQEVNAPEFVAKASSARGDSLLFLRALDRGERLLGHFGTLLCIEQFESFQGGKAFIERVGKAIQHEGRRDAEDTVKQGLQFYRIRK